jgi:hypothetical protein
MRWFSDAVNWVADTAEDATSVVTEVVETVTETAGGVVGGAVEVVAEVGGAVQDAGAKALGIIVSPVFGLWKAAKIVAPLLGWIEGFLGVAADSARTVRPAES